MAVSCPPVLQRLEIGVEAYVETPHRMKFCYTISLSTTVQYIYIYQYITILHVITVSDHIAYVDACLAFVCVCTCIHVFTCFYCKLFDEQPWFPGGWCGPDGCADRQQRACSIFFIFRNTGTTSINFPV